MSSSIHNSGSAINQLTQTRVSLEQEPQQKSDVAQRIASDYLDDYYDNEKECLKHPERALKDLLRIFNSLSQSLPTTNTLAEVLQSHYDYSSELTHRNLKAAMSQMNDANAIRSKMDQIRSGLQAHEKYPTEKTLGNMQTLLLDAFQLDFCNRIRNRLFQLPLRTTEQALCHLSETDQRIIRSWQRAHSVNSTPILGRVFNPELLIPLDHLLKTKEAQESSVCDPQPQRSEPSLISLATQIAKKILF